MVKTRDFFNKIKDTKRTFHAKMGTIKDRNGIDLTEAEEVKRSVKNTEKNYTEKYFNDPDNHNGVITHLEPDILECKVKWVIIMNKASGDDEISAELFQILKDDPVKVHIPAKLENSPVATGLEKFSFHSSPKERQCQRMLKLLHNCTCLIH